MSVSKFIDSKHSFINHIKKAKRKPPVFRQAVFSTDNPYLGKPNSIFNVLSEELPELNFSAFVFYARIKFCRVNSYDEAITVFAASCALHFLASMALKYAVRETVFIPYRVSYVVGFNAGNLINVVVFSILSIIAGFRKNQIYGLGIVK